MTVVAPTPLATIPADLLQDAVGLSMEIVDLPN